MTETLLTNEPVLRLSAFLGIFVLMALWELFAPRRPQTVSKPGRWVNNIGIVVVDTLVLRILFPTLAVGVALWAESNNWGLLNFLGAPAWLAIPVAFLALDLLIYVQHVVMHKVPVLWRLHMMHHTDLDLDVTSGARFHPVEIILSMLIKMAFVLLLGAPAVAVLIFEVVLNATAMFNHSNVRLPLGLDRVLRLILVTPDMHRVHHSVIRGETDSNYGFNLPWWDRIFRTYRDQPAEGHDGMTIGLPDYRDPGRLTLPKLLALPFAPLRFRSKTSPPVTSESK